MIFKGMYTNVVTKKGTGPRQTPPKEPASSPRPPGAKPPPGANPRPGANPPPGERAPQAIGGQSWRG